METTRIQEIMNELERLTQELNDSNIIMASDWRECLEERRKQLWDEKEKLEKPVKFWTIAEIKTLLENNNAFLARAIVKIYERQTEDEQQADQTGHNNGIGFNGIDAFILSRFAKFYMERKFLSPKQIVIARKKMMKYTKQLTTIANSLPVAKLEQSAQVKKNNVSIQTKIEFKPVLVLVGEVDAGKVYKSANRYTIDND